jgi:predicted nucleotide-binding protein
MRLVTVASQTEMAQKNRKRLNEQQTLRRARQNVILELGFFLGKLGRDKVCCLYKGELETPSHIGGIGYTAYRKNVEECYLDIEKELTKAGYALELELYCLSLYH